jgi:hypothetical protein
MRPGHYLQLLWQHPSGSEPWLLFKSRCLIKYVWNYNIYNTCISKRLRNYSYQNFIPVNLWQQKTWKFKQERMNENLRVALRSNFHLWVTPVCCDRHCVVNWQQMHVRAIAGDWTTLSMAHTNRYFYYTAFFLKRESFITNIVKTYFCSNDTYDAYSQVNTWRGEMKHAH